MQPKEGEYMATGSTAAVARTLTVLPIGGEQVKQLTKNQKYAVVAAGMGNISKTANLKDGTYIILNGQLLDGKNKVADLKKTENKKHKLVIKEGGFFSKEQSISDVALVAMKVEVKQEAPKPTETEQPVETKETKKEEKKEEIKKTEEKKTEVKPLKPLTRGERAVNFLKSVRNTVLGLIAGLLSYIKTSKLTTNGPEKANNKAVREYQRKVGFAVASVNLDHPLATRKPGKLTKEQIIEINKKNKAFHDANPLKKITAPAKADETAKTTVEKK